VQTAGCMHPRWVLLVIADKHGLFSRSLTRFLCCYDRARPNMRLRFSRLALVCRRPTSLTCGYHLSSTAAIEVHPSTATVHHSSRHTSSLRSTALLHGRMCPFAGIHQPASLRGIAAPCYWACSFPPLGLHLHAAHGGSIRAAATAVGVLPSHHRSDAARSFCRVAGRAAGTALHILASMQCTLI
jgi:hypothetical protein